MFQKVQTIAQSQGTDRLVMKLQRETFVASDKTWDLLMKAYGYLLGSVGAYICMHIVQ